MEAQLVEVQKFDVQKWKAEVTRGMANKDTGYLTWLYTVRAQSRGRLHATKRLLTFWQAKQWIPNMSSYSVAFTEAGGRIKFDLDYEYQLNYLEYPCGSVYGKEAAGYTIYDTDENGYRKYSTRRQIRYMDFFK